MPDQILQAGLGFLGRHRARLPMRMISSSIVVGGLGESAPAMTAAAKIVEAAP